MAGQLWKWSATHDDWRHRYAAVFGDRLCLFRSRPTPRHVSEDERRFLKGSVPPWALLTESREVELAGDANDGRVAAALAVAAREFGEDLHSRANQLLQVRGMGSAQASTSRLNGMLRGSESGMSSGEALESIAHAAQQAAELAAQPSGSQTTWLVASTTPCTPCIRPPTPYYLELRQLVPVRIEMPGMDKPSRQQTPDASSDEEED